MSAKLNRLLTQVNCRIASIARLRDAGEISEQKAEQELKQAVEFRAQFMRQIDAQNFTFDAWDTAWPHALSARLRLDQRDLTKDRRFDRLS